MKLEEPKQIKFDCGCSVNVQVSQNGVLDTSFIKMCVLHQNEWDD